MKFYDCQTAPSPRRVRMFIAEKGLDVPTVEVDLREGEQLREDFLKINPLATVPVLELDDGTRFLTTAGCRSYLEREYPEPPLLGGNSKQIGVIGDLLWRIETEAFMAVGECLRNSAKGLKDRALPGPVNYAQIAELAERGRQRAQRFFTVLDELAGSNEYLAGDSLTAADIDAYIFVEFAKWIKVTAPEECENVHRWHAQIGQRESARL